MEKQPGNRCKVFISYSHKDEGWKDRLTEQLGVLQKQDLLELWDDRRIGAGEDWRKEIEEAMDSACVAILLITARFLTSRFIMDEEVPRLLERQRKDVLRIVPMIVLPCPWQRVEWLSAMNLRPKDGSPLALGSEVQIEADLVDIVDEVALIIDGIGQPAPPVTNAASTSYSSVQATPGSDLLAETTRLAGDAVTAVTEMLPDPDVSAVVEGFRNQFQVTSADIEALTNYKALHDELHTLELQCYTGIITESKRPADDEEARANLREHAMTLQATVNQMEAIAEQAGFPRRELEWIPALVQAHERLNAGINSCDLKQVRTVILLIDRVLNRVPVQLNDRMVEKAHELDLSPLEESLKFMRTHLSRGDLCADVEKKLRDGIAALDHLKDAFRNLVDEHDHWQSVESDLRLIEASLGAGIGDLEISWPILKEKAEPLYEGMLEDWAAALKTNGSRIQEALEADAQDPNRVTTIRLCFKRYRKQAGEHFYRIDADLRESCGKLRNVGEPLSLLLKMIEG